MPRFLVELAEEVPPSYTELLGRQLVGYLRARNEAMEAAA